MTKITLASSSSCTGCGICSAVCTKGCISMKVGYLGHLFPTIDQKTCVGCHLCERTCPALHPLPLHPIQSAYASWSKDREEYRTSTSGGIAAELSKLFIQTGGVVYGCAMLPDVEVRHIRVEKMEDLVKLKSSKYVQSSIMQIIPSLKNDIAAGLKVLFIGTPCQVAAVKALYKEQPESLYLVDLICHGVPSLKLLKTYVRKSIPGRFCSKVTFREGNHYTLQIWDKDELLYSMPLRSSHYRGWYLDAFMDGYTFRDSCYDCPYACPERIGDMTIGDFWGLGKLSSKEEIPEHPYGCSVVLPITDRGLHLLEDVRSAVELYQRDKKEAIEGNTQLRYPKRPTKRIRVFRGVQRFVFWPELYRWVNMDRILVKRSCR